MKSLTRSKYLSIAAVIFFSDSNATALIRSPARRTTPERRTYARKPFRRSSAPFSLVPSGARMRATDRNVFPGAGDPRASSSYFSPYAVMRGPAKFRATNCARSSWYSYFPVFMSPVKPFRNWSIRRHRSSGTGSLRRRSKIGDVGSVRATCISCCTRSSKGPSRRIAVSTSSQGAVFSRSKPQIQSREPRPIAIIKAVVQFKHAILSFSPIRIAGFAFTSKRARIMLLCSDSLSTAWRVQMASSRGKLLDRFLMFGSARSSASTLIRAAHSSPGSFKKLLAHRLRIPDAPEISGWLGSALPFSINRTMREMGFSA
mmetsp:Transcript_118423/g.334787  ORF Transcript_118423/g.334787 Transcript_118423/m.334787 type:complete len:316 (-) Transcript_118423:796-1743(-)